MNRIVNVKSQILITVKIRPFERTMNQENWKLNCEALLLEIMIWKKKYIAKQKKKYPNITNQELCKKIKKAKASKFRGKGDFLIFEHPNFRKTKKDQ